MSTSVRSVTTIITLSGTAIMFVILRFHLFSFLEPVDERVAVARICEREHRDPASVIGVTTLVSRDQLVISGNAFNRRLRVGDVVVRFADAVFVYTK